MNGLFDLTGKTAFVAGGGGYLGGPVCEALAAQGARVIAADFRAEAAQETAERINAFEPAAPATSVGIDVGDEAAVNEAIGGIERLDILVNLAASTLGKRLDEMTAEEWEAGLRVTLTGSFLLSRAAALAMGERGGSIVHFSSMYGMVSPDPRLYDGLFKPNPPDYGSAKAGVLQLVRYQAVSWAPRGIRVNAVVPGPFPKTFGQGANPEFVGRLSERVPLGRVGQPKEIAGAVVYLASDAGTSLVVDGGWTAW